MASRLDASGSPCATVSAEAVAVEQSHRPNRSHRMWIVVAVSAALAIAAAAIAFVAVALLHEAPAAAPAASQSPVEPATTVAAGEGSILYSDPQALTLAARYADVLFGVAASKSGEVDVVVDTGDGTVVSASSFQARLGSGAELQPRSCGNGCFQLAAGGLQGKPVRLALTVTRPGKPDATVDLTLPAKLPANGDALYRKVLTSMGALRSVHVAETLTSGLGNSVYTEYDLQAPDRIRFETSQGQRVVIVGVHRYDYENGKWTASDFPETRSPSFIWQGASRARLLGDTTLDGVPVQVLSLFLAHPDFPVWFRLYVRGDGRVLEADMLGPSHFMVNSFSGFNEPVTIEPPK